MVDEYEITTSTGKFRLLRWSICSAVWEMKSLAPITIVTYQNDATEYILHCNYKCSSTNIFINPPTGDRSLWKKLASRNLMALRHNDLNRILTEKKYFKNFSKHLQNTFFNGFDAFRNPNKKSKKTKIVDFFIKNHYLATTSSSPPY